MILFNFGSSNHLALTPVMDNLDLDRQVAWWLNGRLLGFYISNIWKTGK